MNTKRIALVFTTAGVLMAAAVLLRGQQSDITGKISTSERPSIAVADMRGTGDAQRSMDAFNATLWDELSGAGVLKMVAKSVYPLETPQRPQDVTPPTAPTPVRRAQPPPQPVRNGPWLTDWS